MKPQGPQEIQQELVRFVAARSGLEEAEVSVTENLMTSGLLDSLGMMRLIAEMEERLSIAVPPTDLVPENFKTIEVMAEYLFSLV